MHCCIWMVIYSWLIIYLHCSSNNRANTVYRLLVEAGERCGYPSRVHSDQEGRNVHVYVHVARLMLMLRGLNHGSRIIGRTINNIRIGRLWRDVFTRCLSMCYHLFYFLEDSGILNPDNPIHLCALHCVYSVRINDSLAIFSEAWNCHSLRTASNQTPLQLWICGLLNRSRETHPTIQELFDDDSSLHADLENTSSST